MDLGTKGGKMKRVFLALLLATGLSLAVTLPAFADPEGGEEPACGDIFDGGATYTEINEPQNTVVGSISLADVSCKDVSYTMYVTYISNEKLKTKSQTIHGDGVSETLRFSISNVSSDDLTVCAYYETAKGTNVIDRAPDIDRVPNCVTLVADPDSAGGGSGFE
jgi:hypothetical protein